MYPRSKLRQVVQKITDANRATSKQPGSTISDYDRTVLKKIKADKRKVQQKVAQLDEQAQQSVQPLVVANEYGSNANLLAMTIPANVDLDGLGNWMEETGLPLEALLVPMRQSTEVLMTIRVGTFMAGVCATLRRYEDLVRKYTSCTSTT